MTMAQIGIRLDEREKIEFEKIANSLGMSTTTAIKMFIAKFNRDKGFDYPVTLDNINKLPEEVEKAMIIAKAEEYGILIDQSETVDDISELKKRW
ncbi:MAG: type II toxin-antitoxin system RelB/DinJ family antitoxin [Lactobacillaceae bacterium]|jgi:DNA-damage-inducible protein J|nr:type II toxin-antitoxin system RelB/DinJ family antitoxin [Lactobacillaceae bacterium]